MPNSRLSTLYSILNTKHRGQSLLEALLSIALGTILIGGSVGLIAVSLKTFNTAKQHLQANSLMRQTAEIIESLARDNWHNIYDLYPGIHYKLAKQGNAYAIQKGEEKLFDSQNMVSYWSFDEATSTIAYDNQSTNNGTLTNGPTWQSSSNCVSGSCLSFNGTNNYVGVPDDTSLKPSQITAEVWVYPTVISVNQAILGKGDGGSTGGGYNFVIYSSNYPSFWIYDGTGNLQNLSFNVGISANQWYHLVYTYDGTTAKAYVNGIYKNSLSVSGFTQKNIPLGIGSFSGGGWYFNGLIDEVRIYNRALSADEIQAHYKAGLDKLGLISYWALDENGGTTAYDNQSTNNGTLVNGPTWQSPSNCVSGSCLSFNGSSNYVDVGNSSSLNISNALTLEVWVNAGIQTTNYNGIVSKTDSNTNGYEIRTTGYTTTQTTVQFRIDGDTGSPGSYTINNGQWYHLVGVYNGTQSLFYVNGVLVNSKNYSTTILQNSRDLLIGKLAYAGLFFNGLIDEPRIYNRALSAEEISQRYQASYTKYFVTNKISRTSGNIDTTYSSANDDPSTLKINSVIKYGRGLVSQQTGGIADLRFYLTRSYNNQTFWQTDWSGGSGQTGPISNPGNKFDTADSNINYDEWYHRKIAIPSGLVGTTITYYDLACEYDGGGTVVAYIKNINITDGAGTLRKAIWNSGDALPTFAVHLTSDATQSYSFNTESNGLKLSYSMVAAANAYLYIDMSSVADYLIQTGDYVEYDVYWPTDVPTVKKIAFDFTTNSATLRDSGAVDQNGLSAHPSADLSTYATTGSIYMTTPTSTQACLISSILDTGVSGGAGFNSLLWQGDIGTGTTIINFYIAFSNCSNGASNYPTCNTGTWSYYGPYAPNKSVSYPLLTAGTGNPQNNRYIRYKVYLSTTGTTPTVNDIIINWSP